MRGVGWRRLRRRSKFWPEHFLGHNLRIDMTAVAQTATASRRHGRHGQLENCTRSISAWPRATAPATEFQCPSRSANPASQTPSISYRSRSPLVLRGRESRAQTYLGMLTLGRQHISLHHQAGRRLMFNVRPCPLLAPTARFSGSARTSESVRAVGVGAGAGDTHMVGG